jgi:hypothetical protein
VYCSQSCKYTHWKESGHSILCTGRIGDSTAEEDELYQLKVFAVQTNEIFLMICDIVARFVACHEADGVNVLIELNDFVREVWWDAIEAPKKQNKKVFQRTLKNLVKELYTHLNKVFHLEEKGLHSYINEDWIAR